MDVLVNFLNPTRMGQLRQVTQSVSLDDVAEMATTGFRSMNVQREDSVVFLLGLLNLGTILCYAVYAQLFKPVRRSPSQLEDNPFVFKKIQTILDELVLHVHTTTYYSSSLEKSQELGKGLRDMTFSGRSAASISPIQSVFSFFDLAEPNLYGEKEPTLPLETSSKRTMDDYRDYLQEEAKKLMQEWLAAVVEMMATPLGGGRSKRQTRMSFPNVFRMNSTARQSSVAQLRKRVPVPKSLPGSERKSSQQEPQPTWKLNRERWSHRRPQSKRPVSADSTTRTTRSTTMSTSSSKTQTDGQESSTAPYAADSVHQPDVPHPNHQDVPVLPVHSLFPHDTVRDATNRGNRRSHTAQPARASSRSGTRRKDSNGNRNQTKTEPLTTSTTMTTTTTTTTTSSPAPVPRHIPSMTDFRQPLYRHPQPIYHYDMEESASSNVAVEEEDLIVRLMHLIQQTTPLAMDVLGVYQMKSDIQSSTEPKCLERLLCQLNQEWKSKGAVPAAMAPFFSIMTGWLLERSTAPNLSHVLMAVRAGWIGKQCSTLYPRCASSGRPQWTVTPLYDDSLNLPSIGQPPVKVRPPYDFFVPTSTAATVHTDSTQRPQSSSVRTITSTKPLISQSSEATDLRTTPSPAAVTNEGVKKTDKSPPASVRDSSDADNANKGVWGQHLIKLGEEEQSTSALIRTSLQVDRNAGNINDRMDNPKPWGKPSRFSGSDTVELSDIVRGVYPPDTEKAQHDEEEEEDEYEDDEEESQDDEEEEDEEENNEDDSHYHHGDQENRPDTHRPETEASTHKTTHHLTHDSIFHDLNKNHFTQKQPEDPAKIKDIYEEIQKKKTDRLEMVPHRGFVHPWLSEPVWVPENSWPSKTDSNHLRSGEENEESSDRHRDKVSFGHEDAVKDVRLFDFAMQYLRDRSAK